MNAAQLQQTLRSAGWPENLIVTMAAIGLAESSGNPAALNNTSREYSVGLWQINLNAHPEYNATALKDPVTNARAALAVYNKQGLRAWGAYTDGRYRKRIPESQAAYQPGASPVTPTATSADSTAAGSANIGSDYLGEQGMVSSTTLLIGAAGIVLFLLFRK